MRLLKSHAQDPFLQELFITLPFSLIFSHLLLGAQLDGNYLELLLEPDYLPGLTARSLQSFILIVLVRQITRYLNLRFPWEHELLVRLFIQVAYGLLTVLLVDFALTVIYFSMNGISLADQSFVGYYFYAITAYLVSINIYYGLPYQSETGNNLTHRDSVDMQRPEAAKTIPGKKASEEIAFYALQKKIVYISITNKVHYAKNADGDVEYWHASLSEAIQSLPRDQFYQLSRGLIVHRDIIAELIREPENRTLAVVLKPPFAERVNIARNNIENFKLWWKLKAVEETPVFPPPEQKSASPA